MRFFSTLALGALAGEALARVPPSLLHAAEERKVAEPRDTRATLIKQTKQVKKYVVNGTALPDVDFDVGESYAGLMPIHKNKPEDGELYFWFFPTDNEEGKDEITIWLNGGPGCSSLEGFFQENGPVIWQYGTFKPVKNPWSWNKLTNMIWVEQPRGTGFSTGPKTNTNEDQVARQFLSFFKNFVETFDLKNKKIYIAGESYAGVYVPYLAHAMLDAKDKTHFDLRGSMVYDGVFSDGSLQDQVPILPFVEQWAGLFNLNASFTKDITTRWDKCGYKDYFEKYMSFPPPGKLPTAPAAKSGCNLWNDIFDAVLLTNPCFDIYQIATTCPLLWDVLGFPGSFGYLPKGAKVYFNRPEVQKAINAPVGKWEECTSGILRPDTSEPTGWEILPSVIERSERTVLAHGNLDYILLSNGTLLAIQNMTWNGAQGFQTTPKDKFFVPYHAPGKMNTWAASGVMGTTHTERGLTWVETFMSGHMVPQYQPTAALRQLEFLLGRVASLTDRSNFSFDKGQLGNGQAPSVEARVADMIREKKEAAKQMRRRLFDEL